MKLTEIRASVRKLIAQMATDPGGAEDMLMRFSANMYQSGVKYGADLAIKSIEAHIVSETGSKYGPN